MEEQSGREFASTNSTTGAYNATIQKPWLGPEIPLNSCRRFQYLQRPTPSDFSPYASRAPRRGDEHVARSCHRRLKLSATNFALSFRCRFDNVTTPAAPRRGNRRLGSESPRRHRRDEKEA